MIKAYFKQLWNIMKQNRLFTGIYVIGSGLAIAMTMTIFMVLYVKFAPVYPEYNRSRMVVMKYIGRTNKDKSPGRFGGSLSYSLAEKFRELPHADKVTAMVSLPIKGVFSLAIPSNRTNLDVNCIFADAAYWEVFNFRFLSGGPFTEAEVTSNLPVVILSDNIAEKVFASTDVAGRQIAINGQDYKVCGVVKEVSSTQPATSAEIYLPLFTYPRIREDGLVGTFQFYLTATDAGERDLLKSEVTDVINRYTQEDPKFEYHLYGQPDDYWMSIFRTDKFSSPDIQKILKGFFYILLALLFIPALNLSGMISSLMNRRMAEIGVRKAYGATNRQIVVQMLNENLLLTCVGGIIGLLLSYLFVWGANDWIHYVFDDTPNLMPGTALPTPTLEMFFNPLLFVTVFALCLLLNLISALIPTLWALRQTIIQCIYTKR